MKPWPNHYYPPKRNRKVVLTSDAALAAARYLRSIGEESAARKLETYAEDCGL